MKKIIVLIILLLLFNGNVAKSQNMVLDYYFTEGIEVNIESEELTHFLNEVEKDTSVVSNIERTAIAYKNIKIKALLDQLSEIKKKFGLNDWHTLTMIDMISEKIFQNSEEQEFYNKRVLFNWYLLNKIGFDFRLVLKDGMLFLFGKTNVLTLYQIIDNSYTFFRYYIYPRNELAHKISYLVEVSQSDLNTIEILNPNGEFFNLAMMPFPEYSNFSKWEVRKVIFPVDNEDTLFFVVNSPEILNVQNFPSLAEINHVYNIGLSNFNVAVANSLKNIFFNKSEVEKLESLSNLVKINLCWSRIFLKIVLDIINI